MDEFNILSVAEQVFVQRMLPHFEAGLSPFQAAEAVLADDARLFTSRVDDSHQYQGFNEASHQYENTRAKAINRMLSDAVYGRLRQSIEGAG